MSFDESCKLMLFTCVTDNLTTEAEGRFMHLMPSAEYQLYWTLNFSLWFGNAGAVKAVELPWGSLW